MTRHISKTTGIITSYRFICFVASGVLLFMALSGGALGANIIVNTLADPGVAGQCTLRKAIVNANLDGGGGTSPDCTAGSGADSITFSVTGTITLGSTLPNIADADGLTIDGASQVTISGGGLVRVFMVNSGALLTLKNLTVKDGNTAAGNGGGIFNSGILNIENSTLSGNSAWLLGGGIFNRFGTVKITNSTVSGNLANQGGGIHNDGILNIENSTLSGNEAGFGGGIDNPNTLRITNSMLSGNSAVVNGGGLFNGGGTAEIWNSTLSGNSADFNGGGIANVRSTLTMYDSTLSGNLAHVNGGGIFNDNAARLTVTNSTLSGNSAHFNGGGISNISTGIELLVATLTNSIVGKSPSGGDCVNSGTAIFNAAGSNLDTDGSCPGFGQVTSAALDLGPLFDNGGPTQTHALLSGSVAIDAASFCAFDTDQRGVPRPQGIACDIGSFEFVPPGASTPAGANVVVQPMDLTSGTSPVSLTFSTVTDSGTTSLITSSSGPTGPSGFSLGDPPTYYYLTTTAQFSGAITVCIDYSGITFVNPPPRLFHFENGAWVDATTSLDTTNQVICGAVSALSPFALFRSVSIGELASQLTSLKLNAGQKNSLTSKLVAARQSLGRGNRNAAVNQLRAFINEVQALKRSGRLDPASADSLIAQAHAIISVL